MDLELLQPRKASDVVDRVMVSRTVPREWVHRRAIAEVFITGFRRASAPDTFVVYAQVPRLHAFFGTGGVMDPVLMAEIVRQAGLVVAHRGIGVQLGQQFVMWNLDLALERPSAPAFELAELTLFVRSTTGALRVEGPLAGLRRIDLDFEVRCDGELLAVARIGFDAVSKARYAQIRGTKPAGTAEEALRPATPFPVMAAGRMWPDDVLVGLDDAGRTVFVPRRSHAFFYDHDVDHVPGLMLLEAIRQATVTKCATPGMVVQLSAQFRRYVEHDAPVRFELLPAPSGPCSTEIRVVQNGANAVSGRVRHAHSAEALAQ